ncbi:DoxX-like family protein [Verrucomicrobium spinosum]|uniref:DoxX-like family protein n=1 Tax=Verrucomicrobium spinosum TaxID=2736 RepID=UPI00155D9604|nr:DoxX-like family protein [Verrucomicrobium spinosum]
MHKAIVDPEPVTVPVSLRDFRRLQWIKTSARFSIGLVWVWEGLIPKILHPSATQFEMVRRSGWWWGSPEQTLYWLGMAMILAGFGIMSGIWSVRRPDLHAGRAGAHGAGHHEPSRGSA